MTFHPIIAFTGAPQCGKSTAAQYIVNRLARRQIPCHVMAEVRTADEADLIKQACGIVVRVIRPGHPLPADHAGIQPDYEVHNSGDLYALAVACDGLIKTLETVDSLELEA